MLHLLPDLIDLVVGLSRCMGSATEIAQFTLGDLTLIAYPSFYMLLGDCQAYYSGKVKDLWYINNEYLRNLEQSKAWREICG
jgi:hypothetical protein